MHQADLALDDLLAIFRVLHGRALQVEVLGIHLRRDTVIPQWFQASKAAAASDGHAVHC